MNRWIIPAYGIACLALGGFLSNEIGPGKKTDPVAPAPTPFCVEDAQKVVAALRPLVPHNYDTYVYLFGDGDVHVVAETKDSKLIGKGPTLKAAVAQLSQVGDATKAALAGVLP